MAAAEPGKPSAPGSGPQHELSALLARARDILQHLQALEQEFGDYLEQLAAVDWSVLAQQGKLAGIPKFLLERTITDARHVLSTGQQDLDGMLREAQEPTDDSIERVQAIIRLYTDTPEDIHNRCQRLTAWQIRIDQALQQHGEPPLTAHRPPSR
jgi:hypothetical protein